MSEKSIRNKVAVIGAGVIRFGELYDKSFEDMMSEAYINCLEGVDKGISPKEIEAGWYGTTGGRGTGATVNEILGLNQIPISRNENACATGSDAFRNACFAVAAGVYDVVLVVGAEKLLDSPGGLIGRQRSGPSFFNQFGVTMPTAFGLYGTRHMHVFGTERKHFAMVSVKSHYYGAMNPYSHFRREITVEDVLKAPLISWPLGLYDCCPVTDGAAAVIICKSDLARNYTDAPVYVLGSGLATQPPTIGLRKDFTTMTPAVLASRQAYKMAGVGPDDIDFAELHDCFSCVELINYEDLGFCKKGEAKTFVENKEMYIGGKTPCNISGGLKSHGHPIGATGVAQIVELFWQLRNETPSDPKGKRQVPNAEIGLQQNIGGAGPQVSCINILSNKKG